MGDRLRFTILGCGSSPGTPRINGDWGACDPTNPRNRRLRAAAMVERIGPSGTTRVVIDTGPDFREQMVRAGVDRIDAVLYTHPHADHIHGIDDIRGFSLVQRRLIDVYADRVTMARMVEGFGYCFRTPEGSAYPPIVAGHLIAHEQPVTIAGEGGPLTFLPLPQIHGDIISLGFRVADVAYCSDVSDFPASTVPLLGDLDLLVIDALQYRRHPSHLSFDEALDWVERLAPRRAVLTHMHIPMDYATVAAQTPANIEPAHDGQVFEFEL